MDRYLWLLSLAWLLHCGELEEDVTPPVVPPVDRESWETELELSQPGLQIAIQAAYVSDDLGRQIAQADSGVQVSFRSPEGDLFSRLQARRLLLDHGGDGIRLGGGVLLTAEDSLEVQADSLIWDGETEELWVPGQLRIATSSGWERGEGLRTGYAFREWSMERVTGNWRGSGYEVEIRARSERGRRNGGFTIAYDSVQALCDGALISSPRARFSETKAVVYFFDGVSGSDSTRQLVAREIDFDLERRHAVARGEVEWRQPDFQLTAERVEENREKRQIRVWGQPALFTQGERRIEARYLEHAEESGRLEASDQVLFCEGEREMRMGQLVYERSRERLRATGGVSVQVPEFAGTMSSGSLSYDLEEETGDLEEDPELRQEASGGGELIFRAGSMHFDLSRRMLAGTDGFSVVAGDLDLWADHGRYEAEEKQLSLAGQVSLKQEKVEEEYRSLIRADSMRVRIEEGEVKRIDLPGEVKGTIASKAQRINWITGRQGRVFFGERRLERVELDREANVTHRHLGKNEVSRFSGTRMVLHFDEDGLRRAWVGGGAELLSRLLEEGEEEKTAVNRVEGEELEILFEEGTIVQVKMDSTIEGRYYPHDEE